MIHVASTVNPFIHQPVRTLPVQQADPIRVRVRSWGARVEIDGVPNPEAVLAMRGWTPHYVLTENCWRHDARPGYVVRSDPESGKLLMLYADKTRPSLAHIQGTIHAAFGPPAVAASIATGPLVLRVALAIHKAPLLPVAAVRSEPLTQKPTMLAVGASLVELRLDASTQHGPRVFADAFLVPVRCSNGDLRKRIFPTDARLLDAPSSLEWEALRIAYVAERLVTFGRSFDGLVVDPAIPSPLGSIGEVHWCPSLGEAAVSLSMIIGGTDRRFAALPRRGHVQACRDQVQVAQIMDAWKRQMAR